MALAMQHVPASHGGVVLGIIPLATAAAAALVAHERPSLGFWLASAAGAAIVVVFMVRQSGAYIFQLGDLYLARHRRRRRVWLHFFRPAEHATARAGK